MSGAVLRLPASPPPTLAGDPQHCPAEEYTSFVEHSGIYSPDRKVRLRHRHVRFLRHVPYRV